MSAQVRRGALFFLSVAAVAVVGAAGVRVIGAPEPPTWPGRVAVVGLRPQDRARPVAYLALADPVRKTIVVIPPEAVVEVPGAGFLRAYHAWRLGRAPLVRATLGRLFGVDVPFSVVGEGTDFEAITRGVTTAEILPERARDLQLTLEEAVAEWDVRTLEGQRKEGPRGPYVILDPGSVDEAARAVGGLGTRVFVDPTSGEGVVLAGTPAPSPPPAASPPPAPGRIPPSRITVDVLNGGRVDRAAVRTADRLRALGYAVRKVGDFTPQNRPRSVVYFARGREAEGRQVGADLGYPVEALPRGIRTDAQVLVLLGGDARL